MSTQEFDVEGALYAARNLKHLEGGDWNAHRSASYRAADLLGPALDALSAARKERDEARAWCFAYEGVVRPAPAHDPIDHPAHYTTGAIEVIDFIEDQKLGYHLGNVVKYICRAPHKGTEIVDLKKARWYLDRHIASLAERVKAIEERIGGKDA